MDRITLKLSKYFMFIITIVVAICLAASSIFLSRFYLGQQYDSLRASASEIYNSIKNNQPVTEANINAVLIQGNNVTLLTQSKMGMMPFIHSLGDSALDTKGVFKNGMGAEFLYYKLQTDMGDIVAYQSNKYSSDYLKAIYIILSFIFILAILISIPLISYVGRIFTNPILKLQKVAHQLAKGNFEVDCTVNTKDEIETLSNSLSDMAEGLKKKYQLQRDFIANVSHDFKTPLSVIRSYSEAVSDGLTDDEATKRYARDIIKEVDRLNSFVTDLLQLSKLQDGAYVLSRQFINLQDLVHESVDHFTPILKSRNISISINVFPVEIYADKKSIQRVLYNFIDNAIKFSFDNSKIEIFTTFPENSIVLSVRDFGSGIEKHLLEDIWDKYYKNNQSGGMGLGLPICREILKMHGYEYGVNSTSKEGTEFHFTVPKDSLRF